MNSESDHRWLVSRPSVEYPDEPESILKFAPFLCDFLCLGEESGVSPGEGVVQCVTSCQSRRWD